MCVSVCSIILLNLEGNRFGNNSAKELLDTMIYNRSLEILNISRNGITDFCADSIRIMLEKNVKIKEFYMQYNMVKQQGAILIFQGLLKNSDLRVLDMSQNKLGNNEESTSLLCKILRTNKSLVHVDLSFNYFTLLETK